MLRICPDTSSHHILIWDEPVYGAVLDYKHGKHQHVGHRKSGDSESSLRDSRKGRVST